MDMTFFRKAVENAASRSDKDIESEPNAAIESLQVAKILAKDYLLSNLVDDDLPADEKWVEKFSHRIGVDTYLLDRISDEFFLRFTVPSKEGGDDCGPGCTVNLLSCDDCKQFSAGGMAGINAFLSATRGDVRNLLRLLQDSLADVSVLKRIFSSEE